MSIENELKLIPTRGITQQQIIEVLKQKGITVKGEGKVIHQEDTYFDDEKGTLRNSHRGFRIRRIGNDKVLITYKVLKASDKPYKQIQEYEVQVPNQEIQSLDIKRAIEILREHCEKEQDDTEIDVPENMEAVVTVINNRNKVDLVCPDETIIEMAFDTLQGRDGEGNLYQIPSEIEFEVLFGEPENLTGVFETIEKEFPGQTKKNNLSKYARTKKEIEDRKITLEEVSACAILSQILNSEEFAKLEFKGQVLHKHDKPVLTNLDNFKDFNYLVETIRKIKSGEYTLQIPRVVAEKPEMAVLLEGENYEVKDSISLEDMMCLLLSGVKYNVAAEALVDFLDKNFYGQENPITNRLNHSQQVMLFSGLIAKSSYVEATFEERLTCMETALGHDIGHVPKAHNLEAVLKNIDGIFSHEVNGKITLDNIYERTEKQMLSLIQKYLPGISFQDIEKTLVNKATEIKSGIMNHSRKGAEHRENGIVKQAARVADKMYAISDIRDFEQQMGIGIMDERWEQEAFLDACKGNEQLAQEVKERLDRLFLQHIKEGNYGRAAVNVINTVHRHESGSTYDVDQDAWSFIKQLIKRVKNVREECGVEEDKSAMTDAAQILIDEWLCEEYLKSNGDAHLAWKNLLKRITCTGELEVLAHLREKLDEIKKTKEFDLTNGEQLEPQEVDKDQMIAYMKTRLLKACRIKGKKEGKTKEESEEYAKEEVEKIGKDLESLTPEELFTHFNKFFVPRIHEGVLAKRIRAEVHDLADVQLKIKPEQRNFFGNICQELGISSDGNPTRKDIKDEYYPAKQNGIINPKVKIRVRTEGENRILTVKIPVGKKVSERIERSFTYEQEAGEPDLTVEELLQRLKQKHPGIDVELGGNNPIDTLEIARMEYSKTYKGYSVVIVEDAFNGKDGQEHKEIEIKCPEHPPIVTKIKGILKGKFGKHFITDSKIERVQANRGFAQGE